jgi:ABC-type nitrate/sulfonate/bicarbonate transport system substrate-binding protein
MIAWLVLLQATLTISVAGPPTATEYLPLRVAAAHGDFAAEGLAITLADSRGEVAAAEALGKGRSALAATSLEAALRLGDTKGTPPHIVAGLTRAPAVALLVAAAHESSVRSLRDLPGRTVVIPAPGTPEHGALAALLAHAGVPASRVVIESRGDVGAAAALAAGQVAAGMLGDPWASRLLAERKAIALIDLRVPGEAARWLGGETVHAALFARADFRPGEAEVAGLRRALTRALERIRTGTPDEVARGLPPGVLGRVEDWPLRLDGARATFLSDGRVTAEALSRSVALVRERSPIPARVRLPRDLGTLLLPYSDATK